MMSSRNWEKKQQQMAAILSGVMRDRGWQAQLELHSIFLRWAELVDEEVALHAQPLKIVKGVLWVEVENSAWLQQFGYQKVHILRQLNSVLAGQKLSGLRFVLPQLDGRKKEEQQQLRFSAPPQEEVRHFEEQAAFIEDKAAREALIRFWYLSQACVRDEEEKPA